jgi:hypothetical protein
VIVIEAQFGNGATVIKDFLDKHDMDLWVYLNGDYILDYTWWEPDGERSDC